MDTNKLCEILNIRIFEPIEKETERKVFYNNTFSVYKRGQITHIDNYYYYYYLEIYDYHNTLRNTLISIAFLHNDLYYNIMTYTKNSFERRYKSDINMMLKDAKIEHNNQLLKQNNLLNSLPALQKILYNNVALLS